MATGGNGSKIASVSHSAGTADGAPPPPPLDPPTAYVTPPSTLPDRHGCPADVKRTQTGAPEMHTTACSHGPASARTSAGGLGPVHDTFCHRPSFRSRHPQSEHPRTKKSKADAKGRHPTPKQTQTDALEPQRTRTDGPPHQHHNAPRVRGPGVGPMRSLCSESTSEPSESVKSNSSALQRSTCTL